MMQKITNLVSFPEKDSNNTIDTEPSNAGRPIKFIYYDESGKFKVHPDAVDALMQIKGPIGVVSVCGRARQGKSFLLNQLLGRSTGFQVGSTHQPCTKGIWIWSEPLKRAALGGTEYSLVLLDCEGIDAYDQTGTYSAQIFSLAILLSSLFVYNQMGVIDEAALDCLSLVSEMTKHIHVKASGEKETVPDLGHFSPVFVWLLRDFCLDLKEDNTKITPCNYLELALRPVLGSRKDVAARNKIRESIRALFPNRECFTLVSPLNNEADLQHLDRVLLDKYRPEFLSGLNMLAKFVFERTKPKQVGGTVMTGPILVGITKSFLDSLNRGAVPTISSSWQNVEESECQKAFDTAIEVYKSAFDRTKPADEVSLREEHDEAVQKSISVYNASAVGVGSARQKYEVLLQNFCKKAFEDYKRNEFIEADIQCLNAIQNMERKLKAACQVDDAKIERVVIVLDSLLSEYEASVHGPAKWQKLSSFLQQSLQDPILHHAKKLIDEASSDKNVLILKCSSMEDKMQMLHKKLEASEKFKTEYRKSYEDAINDLNKVSECYKSRITDLERKCSSLEERYSSSLEMLDSAKQESLEWRRKYEETWNKKAVKDQVKVGTMSGAHEAEARLAASHGQTQLAWKKADEWKEKYVIAVNEFKANIEKENVLLEYPIEDVNCREEALSAELCNSLAEKDKEIKVKIAKLEEAEQKITTLNLDLKGAQEKMDKYELELSALKLQLKNLTDKYESVKTVAHALEMQAQILVQDRTQMEQKYLSESKRFEEANERCKVTAEEVKVANKFVETAQSDVLAAQNSKWDASQLAIERLARMETAQKQIEDLERQKVDLASEVDRLRISEVDAISRVALLEAMVKERDQELEALKMKCEQRLSSMLGQNIMANGPSLHAELQQRKLVSPQVELSPDHSNETALGSEMETIAWGKRSRLKVLSAGQDSVQDMDIDEEIARESKKQKMALQKCTTTEVENSDVKANEDSEDRKAGSRSYVRLTVLKMQQELTELGFGGDLLELKSSKKKDVYALYKRLVLKK
ncbi:guanylate-binding protein 3-like isoform X2 [Populus alba x Populus x berolinensis]|uniref:Guanylate-binding protein 3-like isoform X2 n=2 Tax=Populus alba x Populus x berolinensis TaxID=444605 RepID=A0AAD6PRW1_9ROSI|nr:guanylate-binding protein 3-like isoform X2 [Populus alba x Populus x berolinensis]